MFHFDKRFSFKRTVERALLILIFLMFSRSSILFRLVPNICFSFVHPFSYFPISFICFSLLILFLWVSTRRMKNTSVETVMRFPKPRGGVIIALGWDATIDQNLVRLFRGTKSTWIKESITFRYESIDWIERLLQFFNDHSNDFQYRWY